MEQIQSIRGVTIDRQIAVAGGLLHVKFNLPNADRASEAKIQEVVDAHAKTFNPDHEFAFRKALALNLDGISNPHVSFTPNQEVASEK